MTTNAMFNSALQSLPQFIMETDADWGMVYDFMESQCGDLKDYHWEEVAEVYKEYINDSRYRGYNERIQVCFRRCPQAE